MSTITTILSTDRVTDSRAVLNTNFSNLNTDKAEISGALTQFVGNGNWKLFYSNGSGDITEVALGANGTVLQSNGASSAPTFEAVSGGTVGPGTINELAYFDTTSSIASLAVATYPSLTELSYVKGVTSAIQTQINAKSPSTSPTFATSITGSYLTASEILITDGSKNIVSAAVATYPSLTELTYLKGVTSAIQTQLNAKGTGNVTKVGTPANNQVGIWTGDGTIEGDSDLTYDSALSTFTAPIVAATAVVSTTVDGTIGSILPAAGTFTTVTTTTVVPNVIQGAAGSSTTVTAGAQYLGSTTTAYHWRTGAVVLTPTANHNFTSVNLISQAITEAASGTHELIANIAIGALAITDGAGATTNAATVYIEGAATGTASPSNNYALWVDDGVTRLDGNLLLSGLTASEIVITDASKNLVSAAVATYPSLTELTYVKGVTSAIQTQINTKANTSGSLTQFVGNTAWRVFYSDGSGDIIELALGADGTFLKSNGAGVAPSFATPAGSGDVSKVGTPVDNQVGVWTGDGTIEGDAALTYDATTDTLTSVLFAGALNGTVGATTPTTIVGTTIQANTGFSPDANDGAYLGQAGTAFSDLFLAEGGVINWDSGDATITQTGNVLAVAGADFRIATADVGTNADSVPTLSSTNTFTNKTLTSPTLTTPSAFTTGGTITLAENTSIALDPAGSADGKYSGITVAGTAGAALAFGDLIYLDPTDSRWELADANAAAAADGDCRGILGICVLAAAGDASATTVLLQGIVRADTAFPALTIGAQVYVSETAGDVVVTQPTTADVVIRVVGVAITADELYFNPAYDYIVHV